MNTTKNNVSLRKSLYSPNSPAEYLMFRSFPIGNKLSDYGKGVNVDDIGEDVFGTSLQIV